MDSDELAREAVRMYRAIARNSMFYFGYISNAVRM
jgi:hypothetical protein